MNDSLTPADPSELYAELELRYTQADWQAVLSQGERLLARLGSSDDPQNEALRSRCQLLLGHANLYGLQRPDLARPHYLALQREAREPDLRRQAEEALQYCPEEDAPEPASAAEPLQGDGAASEALAGAGPEPLVAAPDAGDSAGGDAISRPERLVESRLEPVEVSGQDPDPFLAAIAAASAAAGSPNPAAGVPMPWLGDAGLPTPTGAPAGEGSTAAAWPGPASGSGALAPPRLEVEVVDEPELIEVAQADPSLAEELQVELERIRARRRAEAASGRSPDLEPALASDAGSEADLLFAAPATSADAPQAVAQPARRPLDLTKPPIAEPAVDLSKEDPELVAGLLQVVLSA